jgi:hypothetical protein
MSGKSIADERPTLTEILEKREILPELKEAIIRQSARRVLAWLQLHKQPVRMSVPRARASVDGQCLISSIKVEVKKKHFSFGWNFSCFAAHLIEPELF